MIKDKLFWEKYRPKKLENMILYPRIKNFIKDGIKTNILMYSSGGVGKSSLAGILTKDTNCLKINCSLQNGIDIVREQITEHCTTYGLMQKKGMKTVWLEEFNGTTKEFRKGLRGFIEEYSDIVRFIITANNISAMLRDEDDAALLSRFNKINFDPQNKDEEIFFRENSIKYLQAITKSLEYNIDKIYLEKIVNKNFPNLRGSIQLLQEIYITNDINIIESYSSSNVNLFTFIMNKNNDVNENWSYVLENWKDKTDQLLKLLTKSFFIYIREEHYKLLESKGGTLTKLMKDYNAEYLNTLDPEIHLISYITELKNLFK